MHELTQSQFDTWRATYRARQIERQRRLKDRQELAWEVAHQVAQRLRRDFPVSRIVVIGTLCGDNFHERSDIDLVMWGIPSARYYEAVAAANSVHTEFLVDVLRGEDLDGLLQQIAETGVAL